jgi:hypothetical protein
MSFATDFQLGPRPGEMTPRNVFVPPWYRPHPDLEADVIGTRGQRLGFKVGDVVPERRWAIGADGRVMSQADFEPKLLDWRKGNFEWRFPPKPVPDLTLEGVPSVDAFVSRGADPADERRLIDLSPRTPRIGLLRPSEPIVDEALAKDPRWTLAPREEKPATDASAEIARLKAELEAMRAAPAPEPEKKARTYEMLTCPDCGQGGLKGANGLRFHRKHKHKDVA